ncbi:MAG TPA: AAA family ATPase, partial [Acidimicrobiales bacterium]|nr:AAA family ATPase [Acidimicrobiales bacterium]
MGAREPVFAAACVIEDERRIGSLADLLVERPGPAISHEAAAAAVLNTELSRGFRLSERQAEVAKGLLTSGHSIDFLIGVAGSGKTSTLAAVRAGFEAAGYQVLGTATSGQAAKALGDGAGVSSSTVASLTWRIEHGREVLGPRSVLLLDESAMTSDADVGKLLGAVEASGAKLVAIGDFRQLSSVGPGGALEALASRHPGHVWTLRDNLRQRDPDERHALEHLRSGHVGSAVEWYALQDRLHPEPSREQAMSDMVSAWADDVGKGRDALLVAYHRSSVDTLNQAARAIWERLGRLSGPELEAPGGRRYRAGDRVITLAPGPSGAWVTSQRAAVTFVDPASRSLVALTPEGRLLRMGADDIGPDKLAYGFAMTAHRSQGSTVDVTYALEDGGGRELAYVAMSRARAESHVYVVAPGLAQAADRLSWAWDQERRQSWALGNTREVNLAALVSERAALARSVPPDRSFELSELRRQGAVLQQDFDDLHNGAGRWERTQAGEIAHSLRRLALEYQEATKKVEGPELGFWARRSARRQLQDVGARFDEALSAWERTGKPYASQL